MTGIAETAQNELFDVKELLQSIVIIIPTYNAASLWPQMQAALQQQGITTDQVLVIDSSSGDGTQELVRRSGYRVEGIAREGFRHGATRQMAADLVPDADVLVYLTQDAIPAEANSLRRLVEAFNDPTVGAAYGRQLPRVEADPIERHARLFNYPSASLKRDFESRKQVGLKAAFFSNSFAAYRRSAFDEVGGFGKQAIVSEEVTVVARMLMGGWRVAYQADATVIHSHPFTISKEFARYFDIGVQHGREAWLLNTFGNAGNEGRRFVLSEANFLWRSKPSLLPVALLRTLTKFLGYELGRQEAYLPNALKRSLTSQPQCFREDGNRVQHRSILPAPRS